MSFDEIVEMARLTTEEKKRLREMLASGLSWTEEQAMRQIQEKHGLRATDPLIQFVRRL
jgi:hypothetical protein